MAQNITGHLRYTLRLLEAELAGRENGRPGPGSVIDLRALHGQVLSQARRRGSRAADYEPYRHTAAEVIGRWPSKHPLTVALQALVDYAWRPIEFQPGGQFSFPTPEEPDPQRG